MEPRISIITLGVDDLDRAAAFYEAIGLERHKKFTEKAGGRVLKPAQQAFWGGVQGYFEDTEGNLWDVAWNPDFPLDAEGRISLPL